MIGESFASVLAGAQAGEAWAFERIYRDLQGQVRRYFAAHQSGHEEDLAADVFVTIAEKISAFRGDEAGLRSWVFTIAHHRLVDHTRAASRRREGVLKHERLSVRVEQGDAEADAMAAVSEQAAISLIAQLPPAQSEVLLLRILGGLTAVEVGRIVGKQPDTVRALQHRAVRRLGRQLSPSLVGAP